MASVGALATGVMARPRVTAALPRPSLSVVVNSSVRLALNCVGSSLLLEKVIARNAVWYCAAVALPLSLSTPVAAS